MLYHALTEAEQLIHSLYIRKPFAGGLPIHVMTTRSTKVDSLVELAFGIPPLLQTVDSKIGTKPRKVNSSLVKSLIDQNNALVKWLDSFCVQSDSIASSLEQAPNSHDAGSSLFDLTCESLCRICQLLVVEALADLESSMCPTHGISTFDPKVYAVNLQKTTTNLAEVASNPIGKARAASGPLHFLDRYYTRTGDGAGLEWCLQTRESVCNGAPYLRWDALLPWSLLPLYAIPLYYAGSVLGIHHCILL